MARQIYQERGIAGLYRGVSATAYREIGFGSYFAAVSVIYAISVIHAFLTLFNPSSTKRLRGSLPGDSPDATLKKSRDGIQMCHGMGY